MEAQSLLRQIAKDYPRVFVGLIFSAAAFASSLIVVFFYVLILRRDGLIAPGSGVPFDAYLFLYILFLPPLLTGIMAAALGRRLLVDPLLGRLQAGWTGAAIAALSFLLWGLAGELLWLWIDFPSPNPADVGVIDFLAVLGYGLMGLVFIVVVGLGGIFATALHGWWLKEFT